VASRNLRATEPLPSRRRGVVRGGRANVPCLRCGLAWERAWMEAGCNWSSNCPVASGTGRRWNLPYKSSY